MILIVLLLTNDNDSMVETQQLTVKPMDVGVRLCESVWIGERRGVVMLMFWRAGVEYAALWECARARSLAAVLRTFAMTLSIQSALPPLSSPARLKFDKYQA